MASTDDIDKRTRVGTKAWDTRHDEETKKLSAWRRLHMLLPHDEITKRASFDDASNKLAELVKEVEREQKKRG